MDSVKDIKAIIENNFNIYAKYVITSRALPSAIDGLKDSQRKLLWTLYNCKRGVFQKVTKIAGQAMAYYVHGPASAEAALIALYHKTLPFIEGQGSFGNYVLDMPAAAGRYIEARLSEKYRNYLFNNSITDFEDTYDGQAKQPVLLPVMLPVLLCNGAEGIAVGLSTHILPHAPREVIDAVCKHIDGINLRKIPFPDFSDCKCHIDVSEYKSSGRITCQALIAEISDTELRISGLPPKVKVPSLLDEIDEVNTKYALGITDVDDYTSREDILQNNIDLRIKYRKGSGSKVKRALLGDTSCTISLTSNNVALDEEFLPRVYTIKELVGVAAESIIRTFKRMDEYELHQLKNKLEEAKQLKEFVIKLKGSIDITEDELSKIAEQCGNSSLATTSINKLTKTSVAELKHRIKQWSAEVREIEQDLRNSGYRAKASAFLKDIRKTLPKRNCTLTSIVVKDTPEIKETYDVYYTLGKLPQLSNTKMRDARKLECCAKDKVVVVYGTGDHVQFIADNIDGTIYLNSFVEDSNVLDIFVLDEDTEYLVASKSGRIARLYFVSKWCNRSHKFFNIDDKIVFFTPRPSDLKGVIKYHTSRRDKEDTLKVFDSISLQKIGSKGTRKYKHGIVEVCLDK